MSNWYVLYVRTGYEEKIIRHINKKADTQKLCAFVPKKERIFRRNSVNSIIQEIMFPGYVFIETEKRFEDLILELRKIMSSISSVYRVLYYGEQGDSSLHEEEKNRILELCGNNPDYCVKSSLGIICEDKIKILSGALENKNILIKKIDRHRRSARVEIMFLGESREIELSLEIIEKVY